MLNSCSTCSVKGAGWTPGVVEGPESFCTRMASGPPASHTAQRRECVAMCRCEELEGLILKDKKAGGTPRCPDVPFVCQDVPLTLCYPSVQEGIWVRVPRLS